MTAPTKPARVADARWRAVLTRAPRADGQFVYAVRSTGIFCRPTCPANRPKRENVEFFDTPAHAVRAGYRACKRCRPEHDESVSVELLQRACRALAEPTK